ncbi:ATP-dependent nuclease [Burkholderia sp. GS2Y]|uniref:AAA family ATPase n=1 Tax=Burkholderia theae TaxID=3143496 RepID=A0ABU9W976_9BURK
MHISKITLSNYRSFSDITEIYLQPGMNLVLGENNSGKSTILQGLSLDSISYEPHLSLNTKPSISTVVRAEQRVGVEVCIEKENIWKYLGEQAYLPVPVINPMVPFDFPSYLNGVDSINFEFEAVCRINFRETVFSLLYEGKKFGTGNFNDQMVLMYRCPLGVNPLGGSVSNYGRQGVLPQIGEQWNIFKARLYKFRAERLNVHRCGFGASTVLNSDAGNLAECLNSMQSQQPHLFEEYIQCINKIFPSVYRVQAVAVSGQMFEIRMWLVPADARRFDLSIPLSQAGTGVSQVLAILYVAMTSLEPISIGIDEPNSFLHPKAVRALLQILNAMEIKHQYVITTHSPEVIRAANPSGIVVVVNDHGASKVQKLNPENIEHIKEGLASIGARLSDVYGADEILWVEGETEELTFPKIAARVAKINMIGVAILKVNATGDFEGNRRVRPRLIFDTYKNLSSAGSLIPPAIGFVFDREARGQREIDDLVKESGGAVVFLGRRCYENYLLHPDAIAKVLSDSAGCIVEGGRVRQWIESNGNTSKYIDPVASLGEGEAILDSLDWQCRVNAPKILSNLFSSLLDSPEEYRKTTHSVAITDWLLENFPEKLMPIADMLKQFVTIKGR